MSGHPSHSAPDKLHKLQTLIHDLHRAEISGDGGTEALHVRYHLDTLGMAERGRAVTLLIDRGETSFAQGVAQRGITAEAAREGLRHAVTGRRVETPLVNALLRIIPGRPAEPASPVQRLFARHMPRLARAIAETATGLTESNVHFQQAQRDRWRLPVLVSTLSLTAVAALGHLQPRDLALAAACGAVAQGTETIRNAHREGKIARELGAPNAKSAATFRP